MNCRSVEPLLSDHIEGLLSARTAEAVAAHLETCAECRGRREQLRMAEASLGILEDLASPPDLFRRAQERRAEAQQAASSRTASRYPHGVPGTALGWRRPLALGAAGLAGIAALVVLARVIGFTPAPEKNVAVAPTPKAPSAIDMPRKSPASGSQKMAAAEAGSQAGVRHGTPDPPSPPAPLPIMGEGRTTGGAPRLPLSRNRERGPGGEGGPSSTKHQAPRPAPPLDDERYLDGRDPALMAHWTRGDAGDREMQALVRQRLPPMRDDFVTVPLPRLADADANSPQVAAAVSAYRREAKVLDTCLFRKVTLQMKGASLEEFCETLGTRTGVDLRVARDVADEKVTLFVDEQPARDVMRAVARLFGFSWLRSRRDGAYRYELAQDLRSRLAEEEARSRDQNEALMALDAEMARYRPYLNLTKEQLEERIRRDAEARLPLSDLARPVNMRHNGAWSGPHLYQRLTPADRAALVSGHEIVFRADSKDPSRLLPPELGRSAVRLWDGLFARCPESKIPQVRMRLHRLDGGRVVLGSRECIHLKNGPDRIDGFTWKDWGLATGRSAAVLRPDNARANAAVRSQPLFLRTVSLRPEVSCPKLKALKESKKEIPRVARPDAWQWYDTAWVPDAPHVTTAEFWEAVHRETGANIVADFYSRLYNIDQATATNASLFDALCRVGDRLGLRWKKDGEFLLGRSTSYIWDKLTEVPKRHLVRWQREKQSQGHLPIESLMEMAALTEEQLNSQDNGEAISHCWNLGEWITVGPNRKYEMGYGQPFVNRRRLRFLATLSPEQRRVAFEPDGIGPEKLSRDQQKAFWDIHEEDERIRILQGEEAGGFEPAFLATAHFVAEYFPAGWYVWEPPYIPGKPWSAPLGRIARRTAAEALADARRIYPEATMEYVRRVESGQFGAGLLLSSARMKKG